MSERWQHAPTGWRLYWTRERMLAALRDFTDRNAGPLPCSDEGYMRLKKHHDEWPPTSRILEEWHSMARAYLAAGAHRSRVTMKNVDWLPDEDEFLLENAGRMKLKTIAARLGRSYAATRSRLGKVHGKRARDVQCYLSACQTAQALTCSLDRVIRFINDGTLPATKRLGRWQIDRRDAEKIRANLTAPRITHRTWPLDVGDYERRYGLRRRRLPDGTFERYEAVS